MSVGPSESGEWHKITASIEEAIANATTPEDLNLKVQSIFQRSHVPEEMKIDASILKRLNAIGENDRYPIKAILLANTLFEKVRKKNPEEWEDLEKKFQLLRATYPEEFQATIKELQKEYKFETDPLTVQQFLLHVYQSVPGLSISDILLSLRKDIDIFFDVFLKAVYNPLAKKAREKTSKNSVTGLRDKAPEIQTMFLEGNLNKLRR